MWCLACHASIKIPPRGTKRTPCTITEPNMAIATGNWQRATGDHASHRKYLLFTALNGQTDVVTIEKHLKPKLAQRQKAYDTTIACWGSPQYILSLDITAYKMTLLFPCSKWLNTSHFRPLFHRTMVEHSRSVSSGRRAAR